MARFKTQISLDHIHCYKQPEISGSEPYLLTAFFKIDGDTIVGDLDADGAFLNGPCTFVGTAGSHGNLGDTDVRAGDDVPIPPALGQAAFTVRTFRTSERLGSRETGEGGAVGAVVALFEHESLTDDGAQAGRVTFNREVEKGINEIIPKLRKEADFEPAAKDIADLKKEIRVAVEAAVINAQGFLRNVLSFFHGDKLIGADVFYSGKTEAIDKRFQLVAATPQPFPQPPLQYVSHDYGLVGEIRWIVESDILWYNSQTGETQVWYMDGHRLVDRGTVLGLYGNAALIGPPFRIVGVGDMNGNENADIVWYNSQTGETQVWYMDGHRLVDRGTVLSELQGDPNFGNPAFVGPPWSIVGVGDMDGNGKADIVWYNSYTGETQVWYMNGHRLVDRGTVLGEVGSAVFIGPPFRIVGVGDMSSDSKAHIVWYNSQTGETQVWYMSGHRLVDRGTVLGPDGKAALIGPPFGIVGIGDFGTGTS